MRGQAEDRVNNQQACRTWKAVVVDRLILEALLEKC